MAAISSCRSKASHVSSSLDGLPLVQVSKQWKIRQSFTSVSCSWRYSLRNIQAMIRCEIQIKKKRPLSRTYISLYILNGIRGGTLLNSFTHLIHQLHQMHR